MARVLMAAYTNYRRDPRVRREAESLVEEGHEVTFLASRQPGEPTAELISGVNLHKLWGIRNPKTSSLGYILDYGIFALLLFLHCLMRPRKYDLIHVNNMPDFLVFATVVPRVLGVPVIHDVHDLMPELYMEKFGVGPSSFMIRLLAFQERWAGKFATAVLTVEDRLKEILVSRGVPEKKITVLMNLPDDRIFSSRSQDSPNGSGSSFVMVYHGTLARRLGLDIAIQAVNMIRNEIGEAELRIIGAGEEREGLIALRNDLGLEELVTFSDGFVPVEKIPSMLLDADIGLIPLRPSGGTDIMLPTKLLEYVYMGIPSVVPRTGTICRYFDDEMVQFFEAGNARSLADAILVLYLDPGRRRLMAEQATTRFGATHIWSEHRSVYTSLVAKLIEERRVV